MIMNDYDDEYNFFFISVFILIETNKTTTNR